MPDDLKPNPIAMPLVSPTGTPVMPPVVVPILTVVVAAAGAGIALFPEGTIAHKVCVVLVALGAAVGVSSPGWRR